MKILGVILIVAGLCVAVPAGVIGKKHMDSVRAYEAAIDSLEQVRSEKVEERIKVNLAYRAVEESLDSNPDSLRMAESSRITSRLRDLNRRSRVLTRDEKELRRLVRREKSHMEEEAAEAKRTLFPLSGVAALLMLTGIVLTVIARRQHP
jgi:hypothetical protein